MEIDLGVDGVDIVNVGGCMKRTSGGCIYNIMDINHDSFPLGRNSFTMVKVSGRIESRAYVPEATTKNEVSKERK